MSFSDSIPARGNDLATVFIVHKRELPDSMFESGSSLFYLSSFFLSSATSQSLNSCDGYRQVLCANSFTNLAELRLHRAGKPALDYPIAEGRERVKGGEAACEALDVSSVFCYQPAMSSCISRCFMFMYFLPPHWVPAT